MLRKTISKLGKKLLVMTSLSVFLLPGSAFADEIKSKSITSEILVPAEKFTSIGAHWRETKSPDSQIELQVRFFNDNKWSEWLDIEEELADKNSLDHDHLDEYEDAHSHEEHHQDEHETEKSELSSLYKYGLASSKESLKAQYRFILSGPENKMPVVTDIDITYIKAPQKKSAGFFSGSGNIDTISTKQIISRQAASASGINVISRYEWGADESLRYVGEDDPEPQLAPIDEEFYEEFADELKIVNKIESDNAGEYIWPLEYPEKIRKVIIHHTATTRNLDNPQQAIRDIYYYHAVVRGWGDIGYNYIIDPAGRIYEGRYGGEGVIGAHSGKGNNGSIGIAMLGDYQNTGLSEGVKNSLTRLIAHKSLIHNLEPEGYSSFRGNIMPNIFGHRDISSTTCPGQHLYNALPTLRSEAKEVLKPKEKFKKDYDYQDLSDVYYLELKPEESQEITLRFENIGTKTWGQSTYLKLEDNPKFQGFASYPYKSGTRLAGMNQSTVRPGETATFTFTIKSLTKSGTADMNLSLVIDGNNELPDNKIIPIAVEQNQWIYELVDIDSPPVSMKAGETSTVTVKIKNTGNRTWKKFGEGVVNLGTDKSKDRLSEFLSPRSPRFGSLTEPEVAPGETGTFRFTIKAPNKPGTYTEHFTPVVEAIAWMEDTGMNFTTNVYTDEIKAEVLSKTIARNWMTGSNKTLFVKLKNLSSQTWNQSNFKVNINPEEGTQIIENGLFESSVAPGEIGTVKITAKLNSSSGSARKIMTVYPLLSGQQIIERPIYFFYSNSSQANQPAPYQPPVTSGSNGNDIRIKLGFRGNPEISSSSIFEVYFGNELQKTLGAGQIVKINKNGSNYEVDLDGTKQTTDRPVRVVSPNNGILRINNFENRPAWNQELNDNEYRSIIEIREDEGQLIAINELPLELYLRGLGEVPDSSDPDKIKTIMVAARTYAQYYIEKDEKFPGKPYHLDDNPDVSQKYIGYGLEKRGPNITKYVKETSGELVTYNGELIKTPYFNQSDGTRTRSARDVWGWTTTPYLKSVDDSYCDADQFLGHGVGISGCGATEMARQGFDYKQIIKHYYTGVEITDRY